MSELEELQRPLEEVELAEFIDICRKYLSPKGMMILRRLAFTCDQGAKRIAELKVQLSDCRLFCDDWKDRAEKAEQRLKDAHDQLAVAGDDVMRVDWLETKIVTVATPLRYGSRQEFIANNIADEEDAPRSEVRKAIDEAMKGGEG